jgi:ADP-glucose pyrophosphorylase
MIDHHVKMKANITIATIPVGASEATEFGILKKSDGDIITSFIEKPKKEVLPKPAVKVKQPISFLDHPNLLPKNPKNKMAVVKLIHITPMGNNKCASNLILGM